VDIDLFVEDAVHRGVSGHVTAVIRHALKELGIERAHLEAYIVGDEKMKKNVLAFPAPAPADFPRPDLPEGARDLGELYVNPGYIAAHGEDLDYMVIHGILHLAGYTHDADNESMRMEEKERAILRAWRTNHGEH
jgi:rRNA maturation RNase YbeY